MNNTDVSSFQLLEVKNYEIKLKH